ncbi:MAG: YkgJ family cysteine cluster protein [Victivallaceae bacterium]
MCAVTENITEAKSSFHCARCGNCCKWPGYVRISVEETELIAAFLKMDVPTFTDKYAMLTVDRSGLSLTEKSDGACVFYDENPPSCQIEVVKPAQCRHFPVKWNFKGWQNECKGVVR